MLVFLLDHDLQFYAEKKDMPCHYSKASSPFDKENKGWGFSLSLLMNASEPDLSPTGKRFLMERDGLNFKWKAEDFRLSETAELHIGQITGHYNTT
ncbi:MAG: hypothetical protein ACLFSM_05400 [Thermoplasmata archaeon]